MRWIVLLFVVVPLLELYLLLQLAALIDFWPTVALVLVTGVVGGALAKMEGVRVLRAWRRAFETLTPPEAGVLDGVLVLVGGVLLITPGVLTDFAGLLMLIPFSRRLIAARVRLLMDRSIAQRKVQFVSTTRVDTSARRSPGGTDVVETTGEGIED